MSALLRMFQSSTGKAGGVQEDALLAVSTLTEGMMEQNLIFLFAYKTKVQDFLQIQKMNLHCTPP